jgi:endonuclease YncB( thermonuclease family)
MLRLTSPRHRRPRRRITLVEWAAALSAVALLMLGARELERRLTTPTVVAGFGEAIDGDSLRVSGHEIRLKGLDAPELAQWCDNQAGRRYACGVEAKRWLTARLRRGAVSCRISGTDRYGRLLGACEAAGAPLNEAMVREGLAVSAGGYEPAEQEARRQAIGLWAGRFTLPAEHRAQTSER